MEDVSVDGVLVLPCDGDDDGHEKSTGSPQRSENGEGIRVESPGGSVEHLRRKGFGLKKWRRIKRDGPVSLKDAADPVDDGSKLLKRGLTGGSVNPSSKHVDLYSVEAMQSSEGSVGSVNMAVPPPHHYHHRLGVANGFSPDPGFMFSLGQMFEKSKENIGGKIVSGIQGKNWSDDSIKKGSEKPCSSMDSDLRSNDFVFSSGAVSVANNGEKDERLMMNHNGECSKEEQVRGEGENEEEVGDESKKKYQQYWEDKDQIADSIKNLAALQEALWKEVQSFQELGEESIPLHPNVDELSTSEQPRSENCREENSSSSGSQALILKQKVKHLEHKLEEAKTTLEAKESRIQELEKSMIESELQGVFQRKIETEKEHLMLTRSLKSLQNPTKVLHSRTEDHHELNRGNILRKTCKLSLCFLTQLILVVSVLRFLIFQLSPASPFVVPT